MADCRALPCFGHEQGEIMKRVPWLVVVFIFALGTGCGGSNQAVETPTKTFQAPTAKGNSMSMERKKPGQ
jgi:hypothetical protein